MWKLEAEDGQKKRGLALSLTSLPVQTEKINWILGGAKSSNDSPGQKPCKIAQGGQQVE